MKQERPGVTEERYAGRLPLLAVGSPGERSSCGAGARATQRNNCFFMMRQESKSPKRSETTLRERVFAHVLSVVPKGTEFEVVPAPRPEMGHYATNIALRLAKEAGRPPLVLAEMLAEKIAAGAPKGFFESVTAAPPGFVNFKLSAATIRAEFGRIVKAGEAYGRVNTGRGRTAIVEYASLNIAKPFHVGYLRNIAIGDTLANLHDALGYKVIRWNYLGDWGTQFGKLIAAYKMWGKKEDVDANPIQALLDLYVRFHDEAKYRTELEEIGRDEFRKLEAGDEENRKLWTWFKEESLKEFAVTLKKLNVKFDVDIGESFFEGEMKPVVDELAKKKIAVRSEGAMIVPLEQFGLPPAMVEKTGGGSLYLTRDLANLKYRVATYAPAKILYIVGNEQSLHFEQVFKVASLLGLAPKAELMHVKFGLVFAERGQKFSTREGNIILLEAVFTKAERLAREIVEKKNKDLSPGEKDAVAGQVALGALKYANLKENRNSDVIFDWDAMLDFSGDSGPYLQYTYARLQSIVRKSQIPESKFQEADLKRLETEGEFAVIEKLAEFPEAVRAAGETYAPNHLTTYLYELANAVNRFYESTPILEVKSKTRNSEKNNDNDAARRDARLLLVKTAAGILKSGLALLGIEAPEKI